MNSIMEVTRRVFSSAAIMAAVTQVGKNQTARAAVFRYQDLDAG